MTLTNSDDPEEMLHNTAFHQGLTIAVRQNRSSVKEIQFYLERLACDPSNYTAYCIKPNSALRVFSNIVGSLYF